MKIVAPKLLEWPPIHWPSDLEDALPQRWDNGGVISTVAAVRGYVCACGVGGILTTSVSAAVANCASARR